MKPTSSQYAHALLELSQESTASEQASVAQRFLAFLTRQREVKKLPAILRNLQRLTDMADGVKRTEPGSLPFDYRPGFKALEQAG